MEQLQHTTQLNLKRDKVHISVEGSYKYYKLSLEHINYRFW